MPALSLEERFLEHLRELGLGDEPAHLLVAVSGGCDSVVLLHLFRFAARSVPLSLTAAHLDHCMRPSSEADARWVAGLCAAWGIPLVEGRLETPPRSEDEARTARYSFLAGAARQAGARYVATGHHADDQAETVLFRVLRGTGLSGLAGMPPISSRGILRPLLPFWRDELREFALSRDLRWREDPTNSSLDPARNRLRNEILPAIERSIAPGARRSLVSLADLAAEGEAALERETARASDALLSEEGTHTLLARASLRDYDSTIASRVLRNALRRFGLVLDRTGTRTALQFITHSTSGRVMQLPGGVSIRLEFDTARISAAGATPDDEPLVLGSPEDPGGVTRIGGRSYRVSARSVGWDLGDRDPVTPWSVSIPLSSTRFPLVMRRWQPGDRIETSGGTKTLKKLFLEERIPRSRRDHLPVLVDSAGRVLWVAGLRRTRRWPPGSGQEALFLTVVNA